MANNFPVAGNGNFSSVNLLGVTDGYLQFSVPATVTSYQLLWPSAQASGIKQLQNDGSGNLSWVDPAGGAVTTMAAFGSTPNANGASISSNTLTLQPASSTLPGGVTAGTQTFGGAKTFAGAITAQAQITVTVTSAAGSIVLQPTDHVNNAGAIQYKQIASSGRYNWLCGADIVTSNRWQIVPSTLVDGSVFSTAALSVDASSGATIASGQIIAKDGSAASPSVTLTTQTNKGFYSSGTNYIGQAIAGVIASEWTTGLWAVYGASGTAEYAIQRSGATANLALYGGGANSARISLNGETHATLASVTQFVNGGSVSGTISATGQWSTNPLTVTGPTAATGAIFTVQPSDSTNYDSAIMLKNTGAAGRYNFLIASGKGNANCFEVFPSTAVNGSTFSTKILSIESSGGLTAGATGTVVVEHKFNGHSVLLPRVTSTERDAVTAVDGMIIYNTTTTKFQGRAAGAWVDLH